MKLIYTGAQGTGKSTILNTTTGLEHITEVVRNLSKTGVKINRDGDATGQSIIYRTYQDLLGSKDDYVSDRGLTDVFAYTLYLFDERKVPGWLVKQQREDLIEFNKEHPDVTYVYFPIEFPVIGDAFRDTDETYRSRIDEYIADILEKYCKPYCRVVTITGTVAERQEFIENLMNELRDE